MQPRILSDLLVFAEQELQQGDIIVSNNDSSLIMIAPHCASTDMCQLKSVPLPVPLKI